MSGGSCHSDHRPRIAGGSAFASHWRSFFVSHGRFGHWRESKSMVDQFMELPLEMQQFIVKPVNLPDLELAMKLSQTSVEKLRGIAEKHSRYYLLIDE